MTLIKSLLLGSAAGIVAVASAQAADLPTRKGAPAAEYVKVCTINVGGKPVVGFTLPGSDTCIKFSGYVTAQIEGGPAGNSYSTSYVPSAKLNPNIVAGGQTVTAGGSQPNGSQFGYTTRFNFTVDTVSNTAAGPLAAHVELQVENGSGFDNTGTTTYINKGYVTWAGITAGKASSFFSFTGGGAGWANFISPDQQGFNQPDLIAYTASFGGGFSASISAQDPQPNANGTGSQLDNLGASAATPGSVVGGVFVPGTPANPLIHYNGLQWPDIVGQLKVSQGWGTAQVSGVVHNVNVTEGLDSFGIKQNKVGWGIDAGVSFNLPSLGAGDQIMVTGAYTQNAIWYSGLGDAMWNGNGADSNGQGYALADTYYAGAGVWQNPTAWSITAEFDHTFTPEFAGSLEGSYGATNWSGGTAFSAVSNATTWLVGGVLHYDPVKNLDFEFELLYQNTNNSTPALYANTATPWHGNGNGTAARFEITRSW